MFRSEASFCIDEMGLSCPYEAECLEGMSRIITRRRFSFKAGIWNLNSLLGSRKSIVFREVSAMITITFGRDSTLHGDETMQCRCVITWLDNCSLSTSLSMTLQAAPNEAGPIRPALPGAGCNKSQFWHGAHNDHSIRKTLSCNEKERIEEGSMCDRKRTEVMDRRAIKRSGIR